MTDLAEPSDRTGSTVEFLATRKEWRIDDVGGCTLGVLAPQLDDPTYRHVLASNGTARGVIDALAHRTELAAFTHDPHDGFRLHTDANRSYPLYWRRSGDLVTASDDHRVLAAAAPGEGSASSVREFAHAGFTVGTRTMYEGVHCAPADAEIRVDTVHAERWDHSRISLPGHGPLTDLEEAGTVFYDALRESVDDLATQNPAATFLLPLSGGSDSRLLAAALCDVAPDRTVAFTYGTSRSAETRTSRAVAEALGIPWTALEMSPRDIRRRWRSAANAPFLAHAHAGNALPHVQDWYAIALLHERGTLTSDSIVLPGHTAARTYSPPAAPPKDGMYGRGELLDALLAQHFNQRGDVPTTEPVRSLLVPALSAELPSSEGHFDELAAARLIQRFNIQHRQVKYILNSVRTYEHHGARWSMPLLSGRCHSALGQIDWSVRRTKHWYHSLTDREMNRLAGNRAHGLELAGAGPSGPSAPGNGARGRLRSARPLIRSARGLLRNLHHPMAFQAYAPSRREYLTALAHRCSPLGVYAEAFLEDRWNPHYRWSDSATWSTPPVTSISRFSVPPATP
ncbi:asparagine synthase-related protein [Brachybacterium sp. sponge]|uniref:asparagine synthase-related protein n=1 Tax=Brachybacterium sp. sponge TaxID=1775432 RepID=UPI0007A38C0F|nr:asparagine synthase-related protein [Brachybacterium sp. sponge]